MRYLLKYVHHHDIRVGDHATYSDAREKEVAINATTDKRAIGEAKKEWARITSQKEGKAAVVFVSLVKVVSWKPKNKEVRLS